MIDPLTARVDVALDVAALRARLGSCRGDDALSTPPIPRHNERTRPDPSAGSSGGVLLAHIVARVAPICDRPTFCYHPSVQVLLAPEAHGNHAAVAIGVSAAAPHRRAAYPIGQGHGSTLTASPSLTTRVQAQLGAFRCIYAVQPDAGSMEVKRIPVYDSSNATLLIPRLKSACYEDHECYGTEHADGQPTTRPEQGGNPIAGTSKISRLVRMSRQPVRLLQGSRSRI